MTLEGLLGLDPAGKLIMSYLEEEDLSALASVSKRINKRVNQYRAQIAQQNLQDVVPHEEDIVVPEEDIVVPKPLTKQVPGLTLQQMASYQQDGYFFRSLNPTDVASLENKQGLSPLGGGVGEKFVTQHIKQTGYTGMISVARNPSGSRKFQSGAVAVVSLYGLRCLDSDHISAILASDDSATENDRMNVGKASEYLVLGLIPFKNIVCWSKSGFPVDQSQYQLSKARRSEVRVKRGGKKVAKFTKRDKEELVRLEAKLAKEGSLKSKDQKRLEELQKLSKSQG